MNPSSALRPATGIPRGPGRFEGFAGGIRAVIALDDKDWRRVDEILQREGGSIVNEQPHVFVVATSRGREMFLTRAGAERFVASTRDAINNANAKRARKNAKRLAARDLRQGDYQTVFEVDGAVVTVKGEWSRP
jgi:hypothetical protein